MLPDVLAEGLSIVFCGGEGGAGRARKEDCYYAVPGDKFWDTMHRVGLLPACLVPEDFRSVILSGIGLTEDHQPDSLISKIRRYEPRILCFNGKKHAKNYFGRRNIEYGFQAGSIGKTRIYVAPSTSPSAARYWDEKWWFLLADSAGLSVTRVDRSNYYKPDDFTKMLDLVPIEGAAAPENALRATETDFIRAVGDIELHYSIPLHIKNMFEIARALFVYGYLYYPFCTLAVEQALKSLEALISLKYDSIEGPLVNRQGYHSSLADKINFIYSRKLISRAQKEILHDCRQLRNMSFHPRYQQILGHHDGALRVLANLMNEVWTARQH